MVEPGSWKFRQGRRLRQRRAKDASKHALRHPPIPLWRSGAHRRNPARNHPRGAPIAALVKRRRQSATPLQWQIAQRMTLGLSDIVPEALHRRVGWDIRHHFMTEKIVDQFALALPRDRELIRQLVVVYVLEGRTKPPEARAHHDEMATPSKPAQKTARAVEGPRAGAAGNQARVHGERRRGAELDRNL